MRCHDHCYISTIVSIIVKLLLEDDKGVHISDVGGDVIGVNISGSGNIIGKNIDIFEPIKINKQHLAKVPDEYAKALNDFSESINQQLKSRNIAQPSVNAIQVGIDELVQEAEGTNLESVDDIKKARLKASFINMAKSVLKILPSAAETISAFTPLAPFSKLIGEGTQHIVEGIQKEV